jgi:hypothetical protein
VQVSKSTPLSAEGGVLDGVVDQREGVLVVDQVPQPVAGQYQAVVLRAEREQRDLRLRGQARRLQVAVAQGPATMSKV